MEWFVISLALVTLLIGPEKRVDADIVSLWVPDLLKNGSDEAAILDCVYNYEEREKDSLEIKWYFRNELLPIYQWLPPKKPQVLSSLFTDHIVPEFSIGNDPYTQYRALNLHSLDTSLSGVYSCRVSSNVQDSFGSKQMIIFAEPKRSEFVIESAVAPSDASQSYSRWVNLTCVVAYAYPQPYAAIKRTTELGTIQDLSDWSQKVVSWYNGSFHVKSSIILPLVGSDDEHGFPFLKELDLVHCEITLERTNFKRIISRSLPDAVRWNENESSCGGEMNSGICLYFVLFLFPYFANIV